jgi:hypothetical protein
VFYNAYTDPVTRLFIARLLNTCPYWTGGRYTYKSLFVKGVLILAYLRGHVDKRNIQNLLGQVGNRTRWCVILSTFLTGFAGYLPYVLLKGPNHSMISCNVTMSVLDGNGDPVYQFFVIPLLRVAAELFPGEINLPTAKLQNLNSLITNNCDKMVREGMWSSDQAHVHILQGRPIPSGVSLKGLWFPFFRVMNLLTSNFQKDPETSGNVGRRQLIAKKYITNEEKIEMRDRPPIATTIDGRWHQVMGVAPLWGEGDSAYQEVGYVNPGNLW